MSNTRNGEYKLYKMDESQLARFNPRPINHFKELAFENIEKMREYFLKRNNCNVNILQEDTRIKTSIPNDSVDLIVTSPPYGDSRTTVAYGQFSRLALQWMDFENGLVKNIDKNGLGGIPSETLNNKLESPTLDNALKEISKVDEERAKDVLSFYDDFWKCIAELDRITKQGAHLCFVVGNRTVKKFRIPTDRIIVELFESAGDYNHLKTIDRNIPSKRLPKLNSPSNIKGDLIATMNKEYIVILEKA
jgi:DNA modification methylase